MGNGPASTGDGSKYAGKGFIHLTGKGMYTDMSDAWNAANPSNPKHFDEADIDELVNNSETALLASLYYWNTKKYKGKSANHYADQDDVHNLTYLVNGGYNNESERDSIKKRALKVLK